MAVRLAADENFRGRIIRRLRRRRSDLDILTVQEAGLAGASDSRILAWAAGLGRVLLTHDSRTLPALAHEHVRSGVPLPGVVRVREDLPTGRAIEDLLLLLECSLDEEWAGQVRFVPL